MAEPKQVVFQLITVWIFSLSITKAYKCDLIYCVSGRIIEMDR